MTGIFWEKVVTKVVELENGSLLSYSGNYSAFSLKKRSFAMPSTKPI